MDRRIYASFVHQTKHSQTLEGNVKEAATERLFSSTAAFIWHLTAEVGKKMFKVTHESCYDKLTHHPSLSHFHLLIFSAIQSRKKSL